MTWIILKPLIILHWLSGHLPTWSVWPAKCKLSSSLRNMTLATHKACKTYPRYMSRKRKWKMNFFVNSSNHCEELSGCKSGISKAQSGRPQKINYEKKKKIWAVTNKNPEQTMKDVHVNLYLVVSGKNVQKCSTRGPQNEMEEEETASSSSCPCSCAPKMGIFISFIYFSI